jgi:hypothetical protein
MTDKLNETFNLPTSQEELVAELEKRYQFSEDPDLKEVARLSLEAYKEQMVDIKNFEPKYRARSLEVANQYLNLAKDALAKDEEIRMKREKLDSDLKKKKEKENGEEGGEEEGTFDRDEFMLRLIEGGKDNE